MPTVFASTGREPAYDFIPLTVDANIDFTDPEGPTGGICPRGLYAGGAGNIVLTCVGAPGGLGVTPPAPAARTVAFAEGETQFIFVTGITDSGTDATGIIAIL